MFASQQPPFSQVVGGGTTQRPKQAFSEGCQVASHRVRFVQIRSENDGGIMFCT